MKNPAVIFNSLRLLNTIVRVQFKLLNFPCSNDHCLLFVERSSQRRRQLGYINRGVSQKNQISMPMNFHTNRNTGHTKDYTVRGHFHRENPA